MRALRSFLALLCLAGLVGLPLIDANSVCAGDAACAGVVHWDGACPCDQHSGCAPHAEPVEAELGPADCACDDAGVAGSRSFLPASSRLPPAAPGIACPGPVLVRSHTRTCPRRSFEPRRSRAPPPAIAGLAHVATIRLNI